MLLLPDPPPLIFWAFSPSVPQMPPCSWPFYFNKIFNTLGMKIWKKNPITHCCVFSKNNPAVLVSTVWCTEQTVRGRAEHQAHVQHPGLNQQETGRAKCSDGLVVTLLEVSKSPFGALTICSTGCSFLYWFRSLMHLNLFIQHSIKQASLPQQKTLLGEWSENQTAFAATASMTCGPSGTAARVSVRLKLRVDMRSLFMCICSVQTEMDSGAKSLRRISTFKNSITKTTKCSSERNGDRNPTGWDPTRDTAERSPIPERLLDSLHCNVMGILTFKVGEDYFLFLPFESESLVVLVLFLLKGRFYCHCCLFRGQVLGLNLDCNRHCINKVESNWRTNSMGSNFPDHVARWRLKLLYNWASVCWPARDYNK